MTKKFSFFNFKFNQRFNKQNSRNKQNIRQSDCFDDYNEYNQSIYQFNRYDNYFNYKIQVYQSNQQNTNRQKNRQQFRTFSFAKKFLLLINDKNVAFDSRKISKFFSFAEFDNVKFDNNSNKKNRFRFKRVYVFDEKKEKNDYESKNSNVDNDVYYNKNLKYYNLNNSKNENDFAAHFVALTSAFVFEYTCRCCDKTFAFNNCLYFYLRTNCFRQSFFVNKLITNNYSQMLLFYFIETSITIFFTEVIKTINFNIKNFKSIVIRFNVDVFKNVDIKYDFRD